MPVPCVNDPPPPRKPKRYQGTKEGQFGQVSGPKRGHYEGVLSLEESLESLKSLDSLESLTDGRILLCFECSLESQKMDFSQKTPFSEPESLGRLKRKSAFGKGNESQRYSIANRPNDTPLEFATVPRRDFQALDLHNIADLNAVRILLDGLCGCFHNCKPLCLHRVCQSKPYV